LKCRWKAGLGALERIAAQIAEQRQTLHLERAAPDVEAHGVLFEAGRGRNLARLAESKPPRLPP
jgi:hypothetical protein